MHAAKSWIRAVALPVAIFVLLFLLLQFALGQWTQSASVLDPELVTRMTEQTTANQADDFVDQGAEAGSALEARMATTQRNILNGLNGWAFRVVLIGLGLSLCWSLYALLRQARTFGPRGQRGAWPAWVLAGLLYVGLIVAVFFLFLDRLGLGEMMTAPKYIGATALIALLGLAAFWFATALAASPVMKPSVPFGTRLP